jgi:hypothetical protein
VRKRRKTPSQRIKRHSMNRISTGSRETLINKEIALLVKLFSSFFWHLIGDQGYQRLPTKVPL